MTNAILKRLATKGFITMRKVNARNIHYLVTAEGGSLPLAQPRSEAGPQFRQLYWV